MGYLHSVGTTTGPEGPTGPTGPEGPTTYAKVQTALAAASGATTTVDGPTLIRRDGIGTTKTLGLSLDNVTVSGTQVSPQSGGSAAHSGGTVHRWGIQCEPQSAARQIVRLCYGTGAGAPANTGWSLDTSDPNFGVTINCVAFATSGGTGFRLQLNGGGLKESGLGRLLVQSAAAGEPWEALSSVSAGNAGARFQLTCDAGTPTAGRALRIGYGAGTFSTEVFGVSCATATMGHLYVNGVSLGWTVRNVSSVNSPVTAAWGDRINVDTTTGAVTINLPAVPSVASPRQLDMIITHVGGNGGANPITVSANGANLINGSGSFSLNVTSGSILICHDGDGQNSRVVGARLI